MLNKRQIKLAIRNGKYNQVYEQLIIDNIRKKYSMNQELAILRQRDTKPDEYEEYNEYAESCKAQAKAIIESVKSL